VALSMHQIPTRYAQSTTQSCMINGFNGLEECLGIAIVDPWPKCTDHSESSVPTPARIGPTRTVLTVVLTAPLRSWSDRCRLGLRAGLTLLFPVLARTQGTYTTNLFRTESPISDARAPSQRRSWSIEPTFATGSGLAVMFHADG
jgi:hypothetical protein